MAAPITGIEGLSASVGVVSLGELDMRQAKEPILTAAEAIATALA